MRAVVTPLAGLDMFTDFSTWGVHPTLGCGALSGLGM